MPLTQRVLHPAPNSAFAPHSTAPRGQGQDKADDAGAAPTKARKKDGRSDVEKRAHVRAATRKNITNFPSHSPSTSQGGAVYYPYGHINGQVPTYPNPASATPTHQPLFSRTDKTPTLKNQPSIQLATPHSTGIFTISPQGAQRSLIDLSASSSPESAPTAAKKRNLSPQAADARKRARFLADRAELSKQTSAEIENAFARNLGLPVSDVLFNESVSIHNSISTLMGAQNRLMSSRYHSLGFRAGQDDFDMVVDQLMTDVRHTLLSPQILNSKPASSTTMATICISERS